MLALLYYLRDAKQASTPRSPSSALMPAHSLTLHSRHSPLNMVTASTTYGYSLSYTRLQARLSDPAVMPAVRRAGSDVDRADACGRVEARGQPRAPLQHGERGTTRLQRDEPGEGWGLGLGVRAGVRVKARVTSS